MTFYILFAAAFPKKMPLNLAIDYMFLTQAKLVDLFSAPAFN